MLERGYYTIKYLGGASTEVCQNLLQGFYLGLDTKGLHINENGILCAKISM